MFGTLCSPVSLEPVLLCVCSTCFGLALTEIDVPFVGKLAPFECGVVEGIVSILLSSLGCNLAIGRFVITLQLLINKLSLPAHWIWCLAKLCAISRRPIQMLVDSANLHVADLIARKTNLTPRSRWRKWRPVNLQEMKAVLAIIITWA